jgi:hypothetical protein
MDVVVWLRSLGLGRYEAAFRENEIDETVLPNLTAEDLKELGVTALGHAASFSMTLPRCVLMHTNPHADRNPMRRAIPHPAVQTQPS